MSGEVAGCHEVEEHGWYRPIIIVTHGRIYFSHKTFEWPAQAIRAARDAIEEGVAYRTWHSHDMSPEDGR